MSELLDDQVAIIDRRGNVTSKQLRENFENIKNAHNSERANRLAMTTPPAGSEVTDSRGGEDVLDTRLAQHINAYGNKHITGFEVTEQDTPDMTVKISAGRAVVGGNVVNRGYNRPVTVSGSLATINDKGHGLSTADNIYVTVTGNATYLALGEHTITKIDDDSFTVPTISGSPSDFTCNFSRYSPTISKPSSPDSRYDVFVVNSAYEIERIVGAEGTAPTLPVISDTQVPLAFMKIAWNTTTITDSILTECIGQGVTNQYGDWDFIIQDAIDNFPSGGGVLTVASGTYPEDIFMNQIGEMEIIGIDRPIIKRISTLKPCLQSQNNVGQPNKKLIIDGLHFDNDGLAGSVPSIDLQDDSNVVIRNCTSDGNASSTIADNRKIVYMQFCNNVKLFDNNFEEPAKIDTSLSITDYSVESYGNLQTDYDMNITDDVQITGVMTGDSGILTVDDSLTVNDVITGEEVQFTPVTSLTKGSTTYTEVYHREVTTPVVLTTTPQKIFEVDHAINRYIKLNAYCSGSYSGPGGANDVVITLRINGVIVDTAVVGSLTPGFLTIIVNNNTFEWDGVIGAGDSIQLYANRIAGVTATANFYYVTISYPDIFGINRNMTVNI